MPMRPDASASSGWRSSRTPRPSRTSGTTSPTRPNVPATTAWTPAPDRAAQAPPLDRGHHGGQAEQRAGRCRPGGAPGPGRGRWCRSGGPGRRPGARGRARRRGRPGRARAGPRCRAGPRAGWRTGGRGWAPACALRGGGRSPARRSGAAGGPAGRPDGAARRAGPRRASRRRTGGHAARLPVSHPCTTGHSGNTPSCRRERLEWRTIAWSGVHAAPSDRRPRIRGRRAASGTLRGRGAGAPRRLREAGHPLGQLGHLVGDRRVDGDLGLQGEQLDLVLDRLQPVAEVAAQRVARRVARAGCAAARPARAAAGSSGRARRRPTPWPAAPRGRTAWPGSRPHRPSSRGRRAAAPG